MRVKLLVPRQKSFSLHLKFEGLAAEIGLQQIASHLNRVSIRASNASIRLVSVSLYSETAAVQ